MKIYSEQFRPFEPKTALLDEDQAIPELFPYHMDKRGAVSLSNEDLDKWDRLRDNAIREADKILYGCLKKVE